MERARARDLIAITLLILIGALVTVAWGERIGVHQGQGWDGESYTAWGIDLPGACKQGVNGLQAQRMLPSAIVYYALGALGVSRTISHVVNAFQVLDVVCLVMTAILLGRIAFVLAWTRAAMWVAFAAAFLCFATARNALYYPALTDPMAYALAMATVWAYVERRPLALWGVLLASAFTWPALLALGIPMLVLPRTTRALPAVTGRWSKGLCAGIAVAAALLVILLFVDVLIDPEPQIDAWLTRSHRALWIPTIAIIVVTCALAAYVVARQERTFSIRAYVDQIGWRHPLIAAAGIALIIVARAWWIDVVANDEHSFGLREMEFYSLAVALRAPLWNIVHQVVYFGPVVLIVYGVWPRVSAVAAGWGPAAVIALAGAVLSSISPDGRHLLHWMPFLIVVAVAATAAWWTPRRALGFVVIALPWSKLWLRIGYDTPHDSRDWPDLRYFMQQAGWASDTTFLAHLCACIATSALLWLVVRRARGHRPAVPRVATTVP